MTIRIPGGSGERPATTKVRCPKCRSRDLELVEVGSWSMSWEVVGGKLDRAAGFLEPDGADHCEASCRSCGKHWRLRGGFQITDFTDEPA